MTTEIHLTSASAAAIADTAHDKVDAALQHVAELAGDEPLDDYLRRVGAGYGGSHQDLLQTYDLVLAELSSHLLGMEVAVFPAVINRCDGGRLTVRRHLARARVMEATARGIDQLLWGDAQARSLRLDLLHRQLLELMAAHRVEEAAMLAALEAELSPQERAALAVRLERVTHRAPTRPHPHAPRRPGLSKLLYRPAAVWDAFLDLLDSRSRPERPKRATREPGLWTSYLLGRPLPPKR